ncbi:Transmembrane protein TauE-like [Trema orientale]|uniref:Transmembrane protein TauE-like n=1 Tax=Trema orientale TaxID=63057 RepID=A0A2P5ESJ5_TREOI|nr:Transmembrane protein TauE-like [Trema orientale]
MAGFIGPKWCNMRVTRICMLGLLVVAPSLLVSAQEITVQKVSSQEIEPNYAARVVSKNSSHPATRSGYTHVWPDMKFGWKIVLGGIIGFLGAAFGSVGGVGGGGIFVPMLTLIIGFDEKSSTAISKCMVVGGAAATVFYNLRQRHPTLELPIIDYDLALLFQPMLILGISIGVSFNVILADWMIILLLIIVFLITSTKSFLKGIETWKKETIMKKEAARRLQFNGNDNEEVVEYNNTNNPAETKEPKRTEVPILKNIYWKELGLLVAVWIIILGLQIAKNHTTNCSILYWVLNFLQIPVTVGVTLFEAVSLYKGKRVIASKGEVITVWRVKRLIVCCAFGILAGMVGGLLGLGGGFIMGPLFLELGIPPQVSSATATLVMAFSSSMSVVEYYLLRRFPVPYALYFAGVAIFSALVGQHVVGKVIRILGRASLIIFILSSMIFISAITLGGVGIAHTIEKIKHKEYMGFENICKY